MAGSAEDDEHWERVGGRGGRGRGRVRGCVRRGRVQLNNVRGRHPNSSLTVLAGFSSPKSSVCNRLATLCLPQSVLLTAIDSCSTWRTASASNLLDVARRELAIHAFCSTSDRRVPRRARRPRKCGDRGAPSRDCPHFTPFPATAWRLYDEKCVPLSSRSPLFVSLLPHRAHATPR